MKQKQVKFANGFIIRNQILKNYLKRMYNYIALTFQDIGTAT